MFTLFSIKFLFPNNPTYLLLPKKFTILFSSKTSRSSLSEIQHFDLNVMKNVSFFNLDDCPLFLPITKNQNQLSLQFIMRFQVSTVDTFSTSRFSVFMMSRTKTNNNKKLSNLGPFLLFWISFKKKKNEKLKPKILSFCQSIGLGLI